MKNRRAGFRQLAGSALLLMTLVWCSTASAADIGITVRGEGPVLLFIPGLNSSGSVFDSTCEAFVASHQCILLHLPGFAGREPIPLDTGYMQPVRDRIVALLQERQLQDVTLIGHSLGGTLSLMIALQAPEQVSRLVLVDALPFYPAAQNPAMTVETGKIMAGSLKAQMATLSDEQYRLNAPASMAGMSNKPDNMPMLTDWSVNSDRMTTANAMADMLTTDLRQDIAAIKQPTLVLGAWKAYEQYGSTLASIRSVFESQFTVMQNVSISMSENGYHFLMLDDADWVNDQIRRFIGP